LNFLCLFFLKLYHFYFPASLCGVLVFDSVSRRLLLRLLRFTLSHTILSRTHTHHLSHTISHTPSLTHHLSHTIFHTHLCQPPSFTHHLSHTSLSTTISHTPSRHKETSTFLSRGRCGTWRHRPAFDVAGVTLGHIHLRFGVAGVAVMALGWLWWRAWAGFSRR